MNEINNCLNINSKWDEIKTLYTPNSINNKLPKFYDFYDIKNDFKNVYEPSDDTFLLIDAIQLEMRNLSFVKNSMEMGCGSGMVSCSFLTFCEENQLKINHFCVDINTSALSLTERIMNKCGFSFTAIHSRLFDNVSPEKKFDLIFFNPPYVTTDNDELMIAQNDKDIKASCAGGENGSVIIKEFLEQYEKFMEENHTVILLLSSENKWREILNFFKERKYEISCIIKKKFKNEKLAVFKFDKFN